MKEKIKKIIFGYLPGFVLGVITAISISVIAATYFPSNQTTYDNSVSGLQSTNVQDAIDELYGVCFPPKTGGETITDLLPNNPDELYKDEHRDIRYYGKNPNNYVSFNNELWRIIGVIDGKIKIIRNESIGDMQWNSTNNNNWNNASLKSYLNKDYYNSIDGTYKSMISEETYYLGGPTSSNRTTLTASGYYNAERDNSQVYSGNPTSTTQYIGLMYPSDYGYAAGSSCLSTALYDYNSTCKNSDYLFSGVWEWLQAPDASDSLYVAYVSRYGHVGTANGVANSRAVRPVLYLTSETQIIGGDGSSSNPFQLFL